MDASDIRLINKIGEDTRFYAQDDIRREGYLNYFIDAHAGLNLRRMPEILNDVDLAPYENLYLYTNDGIFRVKDGQLVGANTDEPTDKDWETLPARKGANHYGLIVEFSRKATVDHALYLDYDDVPDVLFRAIVEYYHLDSTQWNYQAAKHKNTDKVHYHFRVYQNITAPQEIPLFKTDWPEQFRMMAKDRILKHLDARKSLFDATDVRNCQAIQQIHQEDIYLGQLIDNGIFEDWQDLIRNVQGSRADWNDIINRVIAWPGMTDQQLQVIGRAIVGYFKEVLTGLVNQQLKDFGHYENRYKGTKKHLDEMTFREVAQSYASRRISAHRIYHGYYRLVRLALQKEPNLDFLQRVPDAMRLSQDHEVPVLFPETNRWVRMKI